MSIRHCVMCRVDSRHHRNEVSQSFSPEFWLLNKKARGDNINNNLAHPVRMWFARISIRMPHHGRPRTYTVPPCLFIRRI